MGGGRVDLIARTFLELAPWFLVRSCIQPSPTEYVCSRAFSIAFAVGRRFLFENVNLQDDHYQYWITDGRPAYRPLTRSPFKPHRTMAQGQVFEHLVQWISWGSSSASQSAISLSQRKQVTLSRSSKLGL